MASLNDIETQIQSIIDKLSIKTITGVLPLTFTAKGGTAADWVIYGNNKQQGVGERTENLFDVDEVAVLSELDSGTLKGIALTGAGYYCVSAYGSGNSGYFYASIYENGSQVGRTYYIKAGKINNPAQITLTANQTLYLYDPLSSKKSVTTIKTEVAMYLVYLEYSSTAMPSVPSTYVPYGYEIPILVNGNAQTFYIGSTPLTEGQSISKTSTGVDIELLEGENTISTTLYNKPKIKIYYKWR